MNVILYVLVLLILVWLSTNRIEYMYMYIVCQMNVVLWRVGTVDLVFVLVVWLSTNTNKQIQIEPSTMSCTMSYRSTLFAHVHCV